MVSGVVLEVAWLAARLSEKMDAVYTCGLI